MNNHEYKVFVLRNKLANIKSTLNVIDSKSDISIFNAQKSNYFKLELNDVLLNEFKRQVIAQIKETQEQLDVAKQELEKSRKS